MKHLKHPKGLKFLFFAEMWERFSFYGLSAILVLYMTEHLNFTDANAAIVFGSYVTYLYITTAIGGILADRVIGYRRCVLLGGSTIMMGHIILSTADASNVTLFLGLGCISSGTGFFKANVSTMVGRLYDKKEALRNSGFAYFYAGINLGSALATFIVGLVGEKIGWHYAFSLAAFGMAAGLICFEIGKKHFPTSCDMPNYELMHKRIFLGINVWWAIIICIAISACVFAYLISHPAKSMLVISFSGAVLFIYLAMLWRSLHQSQKTNIAILLILSIFMLFYWSLSNQTLISIPIFIKNNIDLNMYSCHLPIASVIGCDLPVTTIMSGQLLLLFIITPFFGLLWQRLSERNKEPSDGLKFVFSLVFLGLSFLFLSMAASIAAQVGKAHVIWLILCYLMLVFGELCISPVGLALVTRLAPEHLKSTMMGVWWTISAYAGFFGGVISSHITVTENTPASSFAGSYFKLFIAAIVMAIILFVLVPILKKLTKSEV
ncbi:major facilitator transporter [Candidatus Francisella endociliophora]|uniref:Major facilitator transporter n=1 Tax=Candidatus Francisella endociliophora TaxID=653937 RepID=A0A097ENK1_9GAMM|nr:peptide MFS transporter [Francisella sp. FSC1006]AIT09143.1 major facilitator transporter [Francisella sp. FSC1006]